MFNFFCDLVVVLELDLNSGDLDCIGICYLDKIWIFFMYECIMLCLDFFGEIKDSLSVFFGEYLIDFFVIYE